ncbi:afadin- and alpha-actinin-binding protein B isoform X2 [Cherax quadricarinatus]|uniref:afadin- and alpha-actinin-binding protein B isoform X2 n=1 Tax=Cherax quadricarinatus TaxID=27406 RepID=UPI00387E61EA
MGEKIRRGQLSFWVSLRDVSDTEASKLHRNSSALESLPYFCTTANLPSAVVYLSQELQGMGLGCPLIETGSQRVNLVALINTCWEVTQLYRASARDSNNLLDQRRRDIADLNHCQSNIKDLRGNVEEKERLVCDAQEKERQAVSVSKALASKLKAEKEEVRKLSSVLQQREVHHQHELRKKEIENNRLTERLHRLISGDRSSELRPPSMTVSSTLARTNRSRAKWKTEASNARHEEDLHRRILSQYEAWVGQLSAENDQLKTCLSSISTQMSKLISKYSKNENKLPTEGDMNSSMTSSILSTDSLDDPVYKLEFHAFRDQVQQTFDVHMKTIMQIFEEKCKKGSKDVEEHLKKEISELEKQLTITKDELSYYHLLLSKAKEKDLSFLEDAKYVEERATLEKDRQELAKEKKLLHQERDKFTEAAIRLNRERAAFEVEKVELLRQQFLQELPPTLTDMCADATTSGHESGGSLSSGSIGDLLDSPQRKVAVPNITPPRGNVTFIQSSPVVLGPTRLPKQQQPDDCSNAQNRKASSVFRMKSAPTSRAPSVPRHKEVETQALGYSVSSGVCPSSVRPHTLERAKRRSLSGTSTPLYRSQSRGDLTKDCCQEISRHGIFLLPSQREGEALLCKRKSNFRDHKHSHIANKEGLNTLSASYQKDTLHHGVGSKPSRSTRKLNMPLYRNDGKYFQEDQYDDDDHDHDVNDYMVAQAESANTSLNTFETELISLMNQITQQQEEQSTKSHIDCPPSYEEVTQPKALPRNSLSLHSSAPGSLCGSRRSSRDVSAPREYLKRIYRQKTKK